MATWLILDSNYFCHRMFHVMGHLSHGDECTGVAYGFLREIPQLMERHNTKNIVFAFDHGKGKRKEILPTYKKSRQDKYKNATPEEQDEMKRFRRAVAQLRDKLLRMLGFRNVFYQRGYEADDIIASVCKNLPLGDDAIILGSDEDLFQLLEHETVSMWNPITHKVTTEASFRAKYGIDPVRWAEVKALAGCSTDDIPGIRGVGNKTASRWVAGKLKPGTKVYQKISDNIEVCNRNMPLVSLPFEGTDVFNLRTDKVTDEKWRKVAKKLGMKSIVDTPPRGIKQRSKTRAKKRKKEGFGLSSA